ncbi:MAG: calcium/sodium antiporter [Prevotella sp.]|nr:calcium/sodium antiporter [Prevotella sp.]
MTISIILIIIGMALVLWGADRLTDGAVAIAQRMNVPEIVIGLTIVAMGTSMPEFCVSFAGALKGTADLAVGNVVGSNIFNAMLIVGVAAMAAPMSILKSTVKKDIPFAVFASLILFQLCLNNRITRIEAFVLLIMFAVFMIYTVMGAKNGMPTASEEEAKKNKSKGLFKDVFYVFAGLAALIVGSNIFVDNATEIARLLGVSEAVIGLTIVAAGTSLPELATSIVAARKGQSAIAIGNVIGSNVFNILFIIGLTGVFTPMQIVGLTNIDFAVMLGSMLLLWLMSFTKYTLSRWEGAVLAVLYVVYVGWLIYNV